MSLLQIILIIIIIPITLLNIRFITVGRKTKMLAQRKYGLAISLLKANENQIGGTGNYTAAKYVNDAGDYFLVCRSRTKDVGALVSETDFYLLKPMSETVCQLDIDQVDSKKYRSIVCSISSPSISETLSVPLAKNPHRYSTVGSLILKTAEDFKEEINKKE